MQIQNTAQLQNTFSANTNLKDIRGRLDAIVAMAWHDLMLPSDGTDADGPFPDLAMDKPPTFPSFNHPALSDPTFSRS